MTRILPFLLMLCSPLFAADKPNIFLIFADDLGYSDLGGFGSTQIRHRR